MNVSACIVHMYVCMYACMFGQDDIQKNDSNNNRLNEYSGKKKYPNFGYSDPAAFTNAMDEWLLFFGGILEF